MTKTERWLALAQRQRRFEWLLACDEQQRTANALVAGRTHDLLNLVQIVDLASQELVRRTEPAAREFVDDIRRAAEDAKVSLRVLMALARPEPRHLHAPVGPAIAAAIESLRDLAMLNLHLTITPDLATRCSADELEHLVLGLALDVLDHPFELVVRERTIQGRRWIEIVRGTTVVPDGERFELHVVEAIVRRGDGELATSERRGGGLEVVVALPVA